VEFDFTEITTRAIGQSTIGFVQLHSTFASSAGCGTLIRFGKVAGILTAAHVLDKLIELGTIGLLCFSIRPDKLQARRLDMSMVDYVRVGNASYSGDGPDLAFLRLPIATADAVDALGSFVYLDRQIENRKGPKPDSSCHADFVVGVIEERRDDPSIEGNLSKTMFPGMINAGKFVDERLVGALDILTFEPIPAPGLAPPTSYGGTSGGGAWRLLLRKNADGTYDMVQRRLLGVAFYERPINGVVHLDCHGSISLYDELVPRIRGRWSTEIS